MARVPVLGAAEQLGRRLGELRLSVFGPAGGEPDAGGELRGGCGPGVCVRELRVNGAATGRALLNKTRWHERTVRRDNFMMIKCILGSSVGLTVCERRA